MTVTLQNLLLDIWRVYAAQDDALQGFTVPLTTSGTSGGATTVVDTALKRGSLETSRYNGLAVTILKEVTSGPEPLEDSWVTDAGFDGTSTLTVSPAFSATPQTSTDYLLWPPGLSGNQVKDEIDKVLRNTEAPSLWFPSLTSDPDLTASTTVNDNWTQMSLGTVADFVTDATGVGLAVLMGEKKLRIQPDAANDAIRTNAFPVTEGETLLASTVVELVDGASITLTVSLYNETASAVLQAGPAVDEALYTEARFTGVVPDGCESARLSYVASGAGTAYIHPCVIVQSNAERLYRMPSWFVDESQFRAAFYMPHGWPSEVNYSYIAQSEHWREAGPPQWVRGDRWQTTFYARLRCSGNYPIGFWVIRPFDAITVTADTSLSALTTACDREYLVNKVISNLKRRRGDNDWIWFARRAANIARAKKYGGRKLSVEESRVAG